MAMTHFRRAVSAPAAAFAPTVEPVGRLKKRFE